MVLLAGWLASWLAGWLAGSRSQQNQYQKPPLNDFLALAPEVNKSSARSLDLMTFWPWLQKSTKLIPEVPI